MVLGSSSKDNALTFFSANAVILAGSISEFNNPKITWPALIWPKFHPQDY